MTGETGERRPGGAIAVPWNGTPAAFGDNATRFDTVACHAAPPVFGGVGSSREGGRPMTGERRPGGAIAVPWNGTPAAFGDNATRFDTVA
ncbi:hypothetical protein AB0K52_16070, partial [Glycomyces sp. NPDC049804]|uniref:hypothetical protein n=1 Tax=Glycomyces sp. NPDC049804 TaxID=3154363 RepID=UPI00342D1245